MRKLKKRYSIIQEFVENFHSIHVQHHFVFLCKDRREISGPMVLEGGRIRSGSSTSTAVSRKLYAIMPKGITGNGGHCP